MSAGIRRRGLSKRGFTLLELMVALVIGVITITAVYTLSAGTSRMVGEQHRIAHTQTALRLAVDQIRADIERAGLYGTPNAFAERTCVLPASSFQALTFENDVYTDAIPNADIHEVEADRLILIGNYVTTGAYVLGGISSDDPENEMADGTQLALQDTWQSFRRDFGVPTGDGGVENFQTTFARTFRDTRWLHVTTLQGRHFFSQITGRKHTAGRPPQITIDPPISPGGLCTVGVGHGSSAAPIMAIEYALLNPADNGAPEYAELSALQGLRAGEAAETRQFIEGIPSVLVRREVDPVTFAPVAGTMRIVLEYAVDFDLEFDLDTTTGPDVAPTPVHVAGDAAEAVLGTCAAAGCAQRPEQVRSVSVRVAARTPDAERGYPFIERAAGAALTRYYARTEVGGASDAEGLPASRVRAAQFSVFLPNVAYADLATPTEEP